ncbi:MAG TPA: PQQ-binding-like beta-propeller repeat protein, partial [Streptosporangiaceae bacterium]|nr:PQQ-binding-like beta-propeller repeat protein [Streptosporangiaceae bacterium]
GAARHVTDLASPTHDAGGAVLSGRDVVFGGGSATSLPTVQAFTPGTPGTVIGHLPQPRSDLVSATMGGVAYVAGGFDGVAMTRTVLATTDGRTFSPVANLPVPVRYTAIAAAGNVLWLFGGERAGAPVDVIQRVDVSAHRAVVAGHLPAPLGEATAVVLDGRIYIAGGVTASGRATSRVLAFDPAAVSAHRVASLPTPVADAGGAVLGGTGLGGTAYLVGGETPGTTAAVTQLRLVSVTLAPQAAPRPAFTGQLLIADRGNNRLVLVDAGRHVLWTYPSKFKPPPPGGFYFPDDAFFIRHGTGIISNQEDNHTIVEIAFPSGKVLWQYGHPLVPGSRAGYLNQPDDAFLLKNGKVVVADAMNCRILFISPHRRPAGQIGTTGSCVHDPPRALGYPNGDTPLANGDLLISEIHGSWVSEYTPSGRVVWTVHLPIAYPSDPQQIGPDAYLVADYATPGGLYEFTRTGRILWRYRFASGPRMLDRPSLAEQLPGGYICVNDDYRHRVVIINPRTNRIVWQYGSTGHLGTGQNRLNIPDGFDLLLPGGVTPTHLPTG